jgi:Tfp pilus assembly protein PilF
MENLRFHQYEQKKKTFMNPVIQQLNVSKRKQKASYLRRNITKTSLKEMVKMSVGSRHCKRNLLSSSVS